MKTIVCRFNSCHFGVDKNPGIAGTNSLLQRPDQILVSTGHHPRGQFNHGDLGAQSLVNTGHFQTDYPAAYHQQTPGNIWALLERFGVPLHERGDAPAFKQLVRLTLAIDMSSSLVATAIVIAAAPLSGYMLGWEDGLVSMAMVYSVILLTYGFGTAKGVLRLFDRTTYWAYS